MSMQRHNDVFPGCTEPYPALMKYCDAAFIGQ